MRSFSMDLGNKLGMRFGLFRTRSLDHYLHHHSHLIVTCFDLTFLGRVVRHCHTLPHLYPSLFLPFFLYPFIIFLSLLVFFYSYLSLSHFLSDVSLGALHLSFHIVHSDVV